MIVMKDDKVLGNDDVQPKYPPPPPPPPPEK